LTIKEINEFYKESQSFLRNNQSVEMVGIPYLNPHFPRSVFYKKKKLNFNFFNKIVKYLLRFFIFNKNFNSYSNKKFKYLILSHFVSYDNLNYNDDFYFGSLAEKLGYNNVLFVLIDHAGFNKKKIKKKIKGNYIILAKTLNPFIEVKMLLNTFFKVFYKSLFNYKLKLLSINNILGSVDNQRISVQVKSIFKKYDFDKFFFTFEGNPYEKLSCYEAKKINKNMKSIGYQFSVLRKFQHSIYLNINKKFNPNLVFTIGNYNKKLLISKFQNRLKVYSTGFLKKKIFNFRKNKIINYKKKIKVLVMPEGIPSEIELFIKFCLSNQCKEIIFNFRLHPIFKKNKIINEIISKKSNYTKISNNNINYDFNNNDLILYRGTASVMDAVKFGLVPVYLAEKNEVSVDPLFNLNKNHIVKYNDNLFNGINKILKEKKYQNELKKIKKFSETFYEKPNFKKLINILENY
tara:strand:+ start:606 stop:1991 length:1386 start_codon:yes stop_codon:yes gene_type:complete